MHEGHHHEHEGEHCCHHHDHDHHDHHDHEHHHHHHEAPVVEVAEKYRKAATLLSYMANHNADHTQELVSMADNLREMGLTDAAACIDQGITEYNKGNEKLKEALDLVAKAE